MNQPGKPHKTGRSSHLSAHFKPIPGLARHKRRRQCSFSDFSAVQMWTMRAEDRANVLTPESRFHRKHALVKHARDANSFDHQRDRRQHASHVRTGVNLDSPSRRLADPVMGEHPKAIPEPCTVSQRLLSIPSCVCVLKMPRTSEPAASESRYLGNLLALLFPAPSIEAKSSLRTPLRRLSARVTAAIALAAPPSSPRTPSSRSQQPQSSASPRCIGIVPALHALATKSIQFLRQIHVARRHKAP